MGIRRIIGLIAVIHLDVVEVIVVLIDDRLDRVVFRIEGLYQDLALIVCPAGAAGSLHEQIKGHLGRIVILMHQTGIGIQYAN